MTRIRCGDALPETPPPASPTPASRLVAVTDRRGRPTDHRARGWTSHDARGLLNARLQSSASRRNRREGNSSSLQTLGNKRNRIGIPPAPPCSEDADATAATVAPRVGPSRRSGERCRGRSSCRAAVYLSRLERALHHPAVYPQGSACRRRGERAREIGDERGDLLGRGEALDEGGRTDLLEEFLLDFLETLAAPL